MSDALTDPATIMRWLQAIDSDLAKQRFEISTAASSYFRSKRDHELELAKAYVTVEGSNQKERESKALIQVSERDHYASFVKSEAEYNARLRIINVLETRASICQSLLKIHAREAQYG